jgi:chemotaxis protein methyltransferase CheR
MSADVPAQVLALLALFVEERAGLHYAAKDRELFAQKVDYHAREGGFESLLDYYYSLRYDDPEGRSAEALIEALVVGETYFFRELPGLEATADHIAARAARGAGSRVWCAASATGEEPISLAVILAQRGLLETTEIVASDLSARHLERARSGEYGRRALRARPDGVPPWIRADGTKAVVDRALRARIDWRRVNLIDAGAITALGKFDAILCRNVMIYFDDETVKSVASSLAGALEADGVLSIGASESLLRFGTVLECVERGGAFLYHRADR